MNTSIQDEDARSAETDRVRQIWRAARRDLRSAKRAARRGEADLTADVLDKYKNVLGDQASSGVFKPEKALARYKEIEAKNLAIKEQGEETQRRQDLALNGGGAIDPANPTGQGGLSRDAGGGYPTSVSLDGGDDSFMFPTTSISVDIGKMMAGNPNNKSQITPEKDEHGTPRQVQSPRTPKFGDFRSDSVRNRLNQIRKNADAIRDSRLPESSRFSPAKPDAEARMAATRDQYGIDDSYLPKEDVEENDRQKAKVEAESELGLDKETMEALSAIKNPEVLRSLLGRINVDEDLWSKYSGIDLGPKPSSLSRTAFPSYGDSVISQNGKLR